MDHGGDRRVLRLVDETGERAGSDDDPDPADGCGPIHPIPADLVGRIVAGLAISAELLRGDRPARRRDPVATPDRTLTLIVEWGISLAWSNRRATTFADEALIDRTISALRSGIACVGPGARTEYPGDPVQLHDTLTETVSALAEPLWRTQPL
ncbi:hypothetical protein [Nocardia sp. alder85J]|uniref:hypothetical protein n=1 Tax=Nocardia sp. alder85J TaxID=2862949 RepID=UPI001CD65B41|nr:hypothetical protein [Nocardia sp. alder85J]MCX4096787.1 hypothetical protein [Nocardia sp. alder85J]